MTNTTLFGTWVKRFLLEYLVNERNLSINTRASYRDMLVLFLSYIAAYLNKPVDRLKINDISPQLVKNFLNHIEKDRHCSASTRNQRLGGLHALARFIGENSPEHIEWCTQIRLISFKKTTRPAITYLDKPEMDAILDASDRSLPQGQRDHAILLFLYNSGARVSEAANLRILDIDWYRQSVKIIGKGNKHRICPLWPITMEQLQWVVDQRDSTQHVFLNRNGKPITRFGIHALVQRHSQRAAAQCPSLNTKHVSPHVIRHSTATHLLRSGVDINTIRAWLGHVSINTTNIYAETDLETKAKALATCAPRTGTAKKTKPWKQQADLMTFLAGL
ncbi:tyrosine-type recombinase/integrase [Desulfobacter sp.]|uniref:tyrosine-type recombinase/integrase n=1 Tax=Desulfobacter sp. TaxID=2294 RepID=UPI003D0D66AC